MQESKEFDQVISPDAESISHWAKKLATTTGQIEDAIRSVGDRAADVEEFLKGSKATTNAERTRAAGATS